MILSIFVFYVNKQMFIELKGRKSWATQWKEENGNDFFEKLHRVGLCETMHMHPLLDRSSISENGLGKEIRLDLHLYLNITKIYHDL